MLAGEPFCTTGANLSGAVARSRRATACALFAASGRPAWAMWQAGGMAPGCTCPQISRRQPLPFAAGPRPPSLCGRARTHCGAQPELIAHAGPSQQPAAGCTRRGGRRRLPTRRRCRVDSADPPARTTGGEDAAFFDPGAQSTAKWTFFTAELAVVLGIMYWVRAELRVAPATQASPLHSTAVQPRRARAQVWISPDSGVATPLVHGLEALFADPHVTITLIMLGFAAVHSGLASLRPAGELVPCQSLRLSAMPLLVCGRQRSSAGAWVHVVQASSAVLWLFETCCRAQRVGTPACLERSTSVTCSRAGSAAVLSCTLARAACGCLRGLAGRLAGWSALQ